MSKATEIVNRYARKITGPFGTTWHITWKGQSLNSPTKTGLIEQIQDTLTPEMNS